MKTCFDTSVGELKSAAETEENKHQKKVDERKRHIAMSSFY
jgi:hypothetical protein